MYVNSKDILHVTFNIIKSKFMKLFYQNLRRNFVLE